MKKIITPTINHTEKTIPHFTVTPCTTTKIITNFPTQTLTPKLRDRLYPNQTIHVYFFYANTPADKEALKIARNLTKYVNVTFCKIIARGNEVDLPLRKEYMDCAKILDDKFSVETPAYPRFATPSMIVTVKNFDCKSYRDKYLNPFSGKYVGKPNYLYVYYTGRYNINSYIDTVRR